MILIAVGVENGQNWCIMLHASQVEIEESKKISAVHNKKVMKDKLDKAWPEPIHCDKKRFTMLLKLSGPP